MQVTPTHAFGIHGPIRDNIVIYKHDRDKEGVIFPVGSQLVAFDPEENKMNFFERKQNDNDAITALALSSTKNQVVAAAFYGSSNDGAQIRICKTNNRQNISTLLHRSKINSMCFSGDSKLLICASEESITIWSWEKEKLDYSESITGSITRLSCPLQSITSFDLLISSTGTCHARIWVASSRHRLNNFMIMQNKAKEQKFIFQDHTWLKSNDNEDNLRLAVVMEPRRKTTGSDSASLSDISIAIYQVNENPTSTRPSLDLEETICIDEKIKIFSIAPFQSSPGFYLGGSKGTLLAFEREQDRNGEVTFTKSHHLRQDMDENFISVQAFNTNNDNLLVLSDAMKLYTCCIGNSENPKDDENVFIPFISNDHCGGIVDIDCSLEKSLLVSCGGIENKILIW
jgi:WD40 repeat protein